MAPARPASAPDRSATFTVTQPTGMPAKPAAPGLAPTARISKPVVVRCSSTHNATASASATSKPVCTRLRSTSLSSCSASSRATLCGQPMAVGSFITPSSRADTPSSTMKFISSVVTTSSTPRRDFNSAGPNSSSAPAAMAAATISGNSNHAGASKPLPPCRPPTATAASAPA